MQSQWIMHAYDHFICGHEVIVITPDGHLMNALHIIVDLWRTKFTVTGVSMIDGQCHTHTFNEYDEVLVEFKY